MTGPLATGTGDDYIEGDGGYDVIFGDGGRDDIIGGSSDLFSLTTPDQRPDVNDLVFGGNGGAADRSNAVAGHGVDSDTIVGDNGRIVRLVKPDASSAAGTAYLDLRLRHLRRDRLAAPPEGRHAARLHPGWPGPSTRPVRRNDPEPVRDLRPGTSVDIWGADELHGEGGDDTVYGGGGNDVVYGDAGDDDIVGGWGHDWVSGGTGQDGVLGDDGRIFTFRNGTAEPLNAATATTQTPISTPGGIQSAVTYVTGQLNKWVDLTPFALNPASQGFDDPLATPVYANDVIFGGLGSDFLHGGSGQDAVSGAEALPVSYAPTYAANNAGTGGSLIQTDWNHPVNNGNLLGYDEASGQFVLYDEYDPMRRIRLTTTGLPTDGTTGVEWFLNHASTEGPLVSGCITDTKGGTCATTDSSYRLVNSDGDDVIFGDHGNDWLIGGTGQDTLWGGWGNDLLNADDVLDTAGNQNDLARHPQHLAGRGRRRRRPRRAHRQHRRRPPDGLGRRVQQLPGAVRAVRHRHREPDPAARRRRSSSTR